MYGAISFVLRESKVAHIGASWPVAARSANGSCWERRFAGIAGQAKTRDAKTLICGGNAALCDQT